MSNEMDDAAKSADGGESEGGAKRAPSMKADFNDDFSRRLRLDRPPAGYDAKGKLRFAEDPTCKSYILWDTNQASPPGFGLRVGGKKTYIIRRKIDGRSIMPTVGNYADFESIAQAREKAAEMARAMIATGRNPNELRRERSAAELTLGAAMADYRAYLVGRENKPATPDTLRVIDRVMRKHKAWGWDVRKIREITTAEIEEKFESGKEFPTSNEQTFRWPALAVNWAIAVEALSAAAANRDPNLKVSPFEILRINKRYRTNEQLEKVRKAKTVRNPLKPRSTLGPFPEAAWSKKNTNDNLTGVHYLILMLLWGCRKSEHAPCVWGRLLSEHGGPGVGRSATSHVWLEDDDDYCPHVFFHTTKNGQSHRLPLAPMALQLLRMREAAAAEEAVRRGFGSKSRQFVFPARSKQSKSGHYSDATDLLDELRQEIGLEKLTRHDLRRSFGAVMTDLSVPESIKSQFLNHTGGKATATYTKAEWELLREWMAKIEQSILIKAPNAYNALKPAAWPPIPAPEPHVCRPPAPRSGRPPKAKAVAEGEPTVAGAGAGAEA